MVIRQVFIILVVLISNISWSQSKYTVSGYVKDARSGETLIGANVFVKSETESGASTNTYGFYSISLPEGDYELICSYLGYQEKQISLNLHQNQTLNIEMTEGVIIDEVVISADKEEKRKNVESTQMGTIELPVENIKLLPAIFGEVDLLKAIQLLPGVLSSGEGNAGFYVRGGGPDQNLVLLDEALVYNAGHMLGFFSVFNSDAIKNTTLIKGSMPANYGGRLSSVLDIQMKDGNDKKYAVEGGIGLVSSRLTVQGPVKQNKSSFILSGRRTYILDLAQPALKGSSFEGTNYYFYDLNTKWNYVFSNKNRIFFSGYFGRDVLTFRQPTRDFSFDLPYGNKTATLRWNHLFNDKHFMNLSAVYNDYRFEFSGGQDEYNFKLFSGVKDWNIKADLEYYHGQKHTLKYGANITHHTLTPNTASAVIGDVKFNSKFKPKYALEGAAYVLDDIKFSKNFSFNVGARLSSFSQIGPYKSKLNQDTFGTFQFVKTYFTLEPRISANWKLDINNSIKFGVAKTAQYLHLVSNSSSTLPADLWVPSTEIVKPQLGIQYAIGYFKNFHHDKYEASFEVYYKDLWNQIDYADNYVNDISKEVEDAFVYGKGRAYGAEVFLKKNSGKLNGWFGYTVSRSERSFEAIEGGRWYPAIYDRTHDLSLVANYKPFKKWDFGVVFIYGTGKLFTPVHGFFIVEQQINLYYGPRNSARLDDYHRMDISATFTPRAKNTKRYKGSWTFSVYNVYNRKNPFFVQFNVDTNKETGESQVSGSKITIFPMIPSITYNFKWNQQ
ncbi:MAG: TonB-dependent receptor [Lewinellaceae bacterium]|nr:TonB-dependent receptor [Lewinellaceae bacterium]